MEAPKIPSFFKNRGPKQFTYRPWYYDENKEAREKRNRILKAGLNKPAESDKADFQSQLHNKWRQTHSATHQKKKSNLRLLIIIALLIWITYYILT